MNGTTAEERRAILDAHFEDERDVSIMSAGQNLMSVRPRTAEAFQWLKEHTDGHWVGMSLMVEPRYLADLLQGLNEEGFIT